MSREVRAALILCLVAGVVVGAARSEPSGTAVATAPEPKSSARLLSAVPAGDSTAAPVAEVDSVGTRHLTGREGRTVALTFDDGPHPDFTPQVLRILRDNEVTATFCVVGEMARNQPDLVREIVEQGHTLCDHTVSHDAKLPSRDESVIEDEIVGALAAIHDAVPDVEVPFYRAPGGNFAENVNAVAGELGQTPLGWSIDPGDWRKPGPRTIHDYVAEAIHPGAVVLLHDGGGDRSGTVAALPDLIQTLRVAGYEFVVPRT
ncbi:polysaccharide deacetylase family protein [Jiangella asiatica]|uniref:polysaccharide deacetylase family protein n=1 Tax=Jiangella asiatica TaxID=2530372 RepID=UPI0013A5F016|nr:polysaccharide deacetylase family protein [Jiangella asiatica]